MRLAAFLLFFGILMGFATESYQFFQWRRPGKQGFLWRSAKDPNSMETTTAPKSLAESSTVQGSTGPPVTGTSQTGGTGEPGTGATREPGTGATSEPGTGATSEPFTGATREPVPRETGTGTDETGGTRATKNGVTCMETSEHPATSPNPEYGTTGK